MNKRHLHHIWTKLRKISYGYLLALCILSAIIAVFALRQNNLTAIRLRDHVLKVDQENGDTEKALKDLRQYIYSHMNTNLATSTSVYPPIQLKYRYERLVAAEQARVNQANSTTDTYNDAQKYCEATQPQSFYGAGRLPCIQSYIDSHPAPTTAKTQPIPDSLYKYDFAAPVWSPDVAGWSLVAFVMFLLLFLARYILERYMRYRFKQHL